MKVLVTGHNGYIGSVMVPFLAAAGHDVVGLDTYLFEDCTLGPRGKDSRRCAWTCAMRARPTSGASTRSSISPRCRTIRSAT